MHQRSIPFLLLQLFLVCCASSKDFVVYKKGEVQPVIYITHPDLRDCATDLAQLFEKLSGTSLTITTNKPAEDKVQIKLTLNSQLPNFSIRQKDKVLEIEGGSEIMLKKAVRHFFATYTPINQFSVNKKTSIQQQVSIPKGFEYTDGTLAYKEPYFAENFDSNFRLWNNTNTLEETWGLWGHNIGKLIKVTPEMYAVVDGKKEEEQLNFSSQELFLALKEAIQEKLSDEPTANKFMIMPYDNAMVCQCEKCIEAGNTKTSASPAVYSLIDRLAIEFPRAEFFSTAYISTEKPPKNKTKSNVGVMISTMSFPKGIVIENSNKAAEVSALFKEWKEVTEKIFLWDYAINFDNYFEFYPTVSIVQKNLQFYLKNGVTGIFMHGSDEGSFAAFGDLKNYLYAQLFNNPYVDLASHVQLFLENKYPTIGKALNDYYLLIEKKALESNKTIDIYGGIKQSVNKYLSDDKLNKILIYLLAQNKFKPEEQKAANLVQMAFVFQKLEFMRTKGVGEGGYGLLDEKSGAFNLNPQVRELTAKLAQLSKVLQINSYNEAGFLLDHYLAEWKGKIVAKPYQNLFYKKPIKVLSNLDEDYEDVRMLNDGAIGFNDYYNNWFINKSSELLKLEIAAQGLEKSKMMRMQFLFDAKHKIYPPEKITIFIGEHTYEQVVSQRNLPEKVGVVEVKVPIKVKPEDKKLIIEVKKQARYNKNAMACDEIIFN